jgi:hypothetical protein
MTTAQFILYPVSNTSKIKVCRKIIFLACISSTNYRQWHSFHQSEYQFFQPRPSMSIFQQCGSSCCVCHNIESFLPQIFLGLENCYKPSLNRNLIALLYIHWRCSHGTVDSGMISTNFFESSKNSVFRIKSTLINKSCAQIV